MADKSIKELMNENSIAHYTIYMSEQIIIPQKKFLFFIYIAIGYIYGIGGTAKRLARKASLQGAQIMNAQQMYKYLSEYESDIWYEY